MTAVRLALVGHNISYSLSPILHEAAMRDCGMEGSYEIRDTSEEDLVSVVEELQTSEYTGFNVTKPYKESLYPHCDFHREDCYLTGAVSTVRIEADKRLTAHNTDAGGLLQALIAGIRDTEPPKSALILGAGGAARAAVLAAMRLGVQKIYVAARRPEKSKQLTASLRSRIAEMPADFQLTAGDFSAEHLGKGELELILNCIPIGQGGQSDQEIPQHVSDVMENNRNAFLYDLVYAKKANEDTVLTEYAKSLGMKAEHGLSMLVAQAALAFHHWTGHLPNVEAMRAAVENSSK